MSPMSSSAKRAQHQTEAALLALESHAATVLRAAAQVAIRDPIKASQAAAISLAPAVYLVRRAARAGGRERLNAEVAAQGVHLPDVRTESSQDADRLAAARAAQGYATGVLLFAHEAQERGEGANYHIDANKIDTIAAAETASAFNDERWRIERAVANDTRAARILPLLIKMWSADLESRTTCKVCRAMDGQTRAWGMAFAANREPGRVHPRCRCLGRYMVVPVGYSMKEAA